MATPIIPPMYRGHSDRSGNSLKLEAEGTKNMTPTSRIVLLKVITSTEPKLPIR